ncbi:SDR family oxidoreductase [Tropicimonas sp. TH_r6]|uniref:SDR family NAD(P)-dependent oxidoreductase n=1 Tax=Tropicimonas sp. TH_r6 TaxID=3082085 RepID=UPI0029534A35|nr:SDR family oxidoreductase [Tropicimonas sp. TH_r6]MDV7145983.1 SDR family oxidoreductase [Tropicimonas sp. TH_r6]
MQDFNNKVVVITGGATGIGKGFAKAFGLEGAKIVLNGRRQERLDEAQAELEALGIEVATLAGDVTDPQGIEALAEFAWAWKGKVDVLINNAGMMVPYAPVLQMPLEHFRAIYEVNFFSVVVASQIFGRRFLEKGTPAAIYNVGSENSLFHGTPMNGAYVGTKHSVYAITHSLREELPEFIDVSLICPGFVMSELGPKENMQHGMPTDEYIAIAMKQIKDGEFWVVSHAYNMVRICEKFDQLEQAYATYAPRYEGDQQYDVRTVVQPILEEQMGVKLTPVAEPPGTPTGGDRASRMQRTPHAP